MRRDRRLWTAPEDRALKGLFATGLPFKRIGEQLDRSPSSCNARAQRMGLMRGQGRKMIPVEVIANALPTLPYVPGIIVTGNYRMRPVHVD